MDASASDRRRPPLRGTARVVAGGLTVWACAQLAGSTLARNAIAALAVQAAIAEWGTNWMGQTWSEGPASARARAVGRRVAYGVACGLGLASACAAAAAMGGARRGSPSEIAVEPMFVGLVVAVLGAVRDELVLRGVVLRATEELGPAWVRLGVCGAAAAAARFGHEGAIGLALLDEALRGVALGALWLGDRGAWRAVAANAAWTWASGSILHGAWSDTRATGGSSASDLAARVVLVAAALAASVWALRLSGPKPA